MDMRTILSKLSGLSSGSAHMAGGNHSVDKSAESHFCKTCGKDMPEWEPEYSDECEECENAMSSDDDDFDDFELADDEDELDEAAMCEDCGSSPCMCEDPLAEKKLTGAERRKREQLAKGMKDADWEERYPGRGEEVMYATATKKAKELAEDDIVQEAKHTIEAHGVKGMQSTRWRKTFKNEEDLNAWLEKNDAEMYGMRELEPGDKQGTVKEAKECNCAGPCDCEKNVVAEMRQLAGLTECGEMYEPMPAAQPVDLPKSKMTVTTSMDSEAGTKQVTVTADGDGADELIRVLQMAGINVAPTGTAIVDEVANEPNPQTLGSKSLMLDLAGGPNAPKGMHKDGYHHGDNPLAFVGEAVDRLAARLQARFKSQK
jgi:hypothetical protein